jgi:hypothetical protein
MPQHKKFRANPLMLGTRRGGALFPFGLCGGGVQRMAPLGQNGASELFRIAGPGMRSLTLPGNNPV